MGPWEARHTWLLAALSASLGILLAFSGTGNRSPQEEVPMLPLGDGYRWIYQVRAGGPHQPAKGASIVEVVGRRSETYLLRSRLAALAGDAPPITDEAMFAVGLGRNGRYTGEPGPGAQFANMPYHLAAGVAWEGGGGIRETVTNLEDVAVPAGRYAAWRVEARLPLAVQGGGNEADGCWHVMWLAPGVGVVKDQVIIAGAVDGTTVITMSLAATNVPNAARASGRARGGPSPGRYDSLVQLAASL